jgi:hypothetical protein
VEYIINNNCGHAIPPHIILSENNVWWNNMTTVNITAKLSG